MAGELEQEFRCVALLSQSVEHTRVAVYSTVVDGDRCREHDDVQEICRSRYADLIEDLHERAGFLTHLIPRVERHQDEQSADVEQQYAPDYLIDRFGDGFVGFVGFTCRDAD